MMVVPETPAPDSHGSPPVQEDRPPIAKLFGVVATITLLVVGAVIALTQYFRLETERQLQVKELGVENPQLVEQRAREERELKSYDQIEGKPGLYRIPVERTMELVLANPKLLDPIGGAKGQKGAKEGTPR